MIIIDPDAEKNILAVLESKTHGILLHGIKGVGLATIAKHYGALSFSVEPQLLTKASTVPQISIEQIRELYQVTRGKSAQLYTVLINDGDMMTHAAQNSLLKLLEEPPERARFIITSHYPDKLLPTVRSRLQEVVIPQTNRANDLVQNVRDEQRKRQLMFIASGLPAELSRLLNDEQYFRESVARASLAKRLVESSRYERLVILAGEKLDRLGALALIERMIHFLSITPSKGSIQRVNGLLLAYDSIERNGNVRLQMALAMVY